jgi:hypothetical protein
LRGIASIDCVAGLQLPSLLITLSISPLAVLFVLLGSMFVFVIMLVTLKFSERRLTLAQVYHASARPVEDFFREQGVLREFYIAGGIPETLPRLMAEVAPFRRFLVGAAQQPAGSSAAASAA